MDMDTSQNWLAFSLSSQHGLLFSSPHHVVAEQGGVVADMPVMGAEEPKLEDFLGSSNDSDLKTIAAGFLRGATGVSTAGGQQNSEVPTKALAPAGEPRKTVDTFGQRTSIYRGVTRHRWTGRYEAHLWDNSCRREGQSRKGRQVYLGGYDKEEKAARAYDLAALKYWGPTTTTNFPVSDYEKELEEMKNMTRQEFVASLRRKSSGFSRGASIYRGVTRHHQHGRWQARIGRVAGNKDLYLGTFSTQEEAAEAYDIAAIKFRGPSAVTNFDMSRYDVKSIMSSNLPIGGVSGRTSKASECSSSSSDTMSLEAKQLTDNNSIASYGLPWMQIKPDQQDYWSLLALQQQQQQQHQACYGAYPSGITMDFSSGGGVTPQVINGANFAWTNGVFQQQYDQSSSSSSTALGVIPYATPLMALGTSAYESNSSYAGNWVAPAKPSLGLFQTPIYGIE